jgi:hypothetical protein
MKPIPKKPETEQNQILQLKEETQIELQQSLSIEDFAKSLAELTAGDGDSRHLSNKVNSGRMADLVRRYSCLMPEHLEPLRIVIVKVLIKTMNEAILLKFIENKGLDILNQWLVAMIEEIKQQLQLNPLYNEGVLSQIKEE